MKASRFSFLTLALLAIITGIEGCQKPSAPSDPGEAYVETAGTLGIDIIPLASSEGSPRWLATYSDEGRTTKFSFEFGTVAAAGGSNAPAMGKGRFVAEDSSQPTPLLNALQKILQAKHTPTRAQRQEDLPFSYLLLGDNQSRAPDGSFSPTPKGNWTVTKLFLANDTAEVYFNYNPVIHKAEFRMKDAAYGDRTLAELAKVF